MYAREGVVRERVPELFVASAPGGITINTYMTLRGSDQAMADRYTYLTQIGLAIMIVWTTAELSRRWPRAHVTWAVVVSVLAVTMVACTLLQTRFWHDRESILKRALECNPQAPIAHNNLGDALERKGQINEAISQFQEDIRLKNRNIDEN